MWVSKSSYYQLKQQDRAWKQAKKAKTKILPLKQYIFKKGLKNMVWIYISSDYMGKIENAPVFYMKINPSIYKRFMQNGNSSFVKHVPRNCINVTVDRNWWEAKFNKPV